MGVKIALEGLEDEVAHAVPPAFVLPASPQQHPDVARRHTRSQRERAAWLIVVRLAHRKNERMANIDHDSNLAKIALQRAHVQRLKACRATLGAAPAEQPGGQPPPKDGYSCRPLEVECDGDPAAVLADVGVPQRRPSPPVLQPLLPDGGPTMHGTVPGGRTEPRTKATAPAPAPVVAPPRITLPMPAPPPTAAVDAVGAIAIAAARRSVIRQLNQQRSRRLVLPALPVPAPRRPGATIAAARRLVISQLTQQRSQRLRVLPPCHVAPGTPCHVAPGSPCHVARGTPCHVAPGTPAGMADVDLLPPAVATVTPSVTTSTTAAAAAPSIGMVNAHHMYMVPAGC